MQKLLKGILEFRKNTAQSYREAFARLAQGQAPDVLMIACSDSRVVPNLFASTEPGDLFVVRNVGNLIPPFAAGEDGSERAAVEFAIGNLPISEVIVCGHYGCGAMRALLERPPDGSGLAHWIRNGEEAVGEFRAGNAPDPALSPENQLSQLNVLLQLKHLMTHPEVRARVEGGKLRLHGWWFNIPAWEVQAYESKEGRFLPIDEEVVGRILKRMEHTENQGTPPKS